MKKVLAILGILLAASIIPAAAGGVAVYGSGWDASDADNTAGIGASFGWDLGEVLDLVAQAGYYQEASGEPFEDIADGDGGFLQDGVNAIPIEILLRWNFMRDSTAWHPYLGAGPAYFALDTDEGNIDDEFGWSAVFGSSFGDGEGADLHAELGYRFVEGTVKDLDPNDTNPNIEDSVDLDLSGPVASVGVVWHW